MFHFGGYRCRRRHCAFRSYRVQYVFVSVVHFVASVRVDSDLVCTRMWLGLPATLVVQIQNDPRLAPAALVMLRVASLCAQNGTLLPTSSDIDSFSTTSSTASSCICAQSLILPEFQIPPR